MKSFLKARHYEMLQKKNVLVVDYKPYTLHGGIIEENAIVFFYEQKLISAENFFERFTKRYGDATCIISCSNECPREIKNRNRKQTRKINIIMKWKCNSSFIDDTSLRIFKFSFYFIAFAVDIEIRFVNLI